MNVVQVSPAATHDLRRRVLRSHLGDDWTVEFEGDDAPDAVHLAVVDEPDGAPVAVASYLPAANDVRPDARRPYRLRGMAVEPDRQGQGLGGVLFDAGLARMRQMSVDVLWANARDAALDFYVRMGMAIVGDGFDAVDVPHHVVVLDL